MHHANAESTMPHHVAAAWAESKGAWRTFLFWAIPTLIGLAFSAAFQLGFLLPKFGTGSSDLDRCIELAKLYDQGLSDEPTVVFIGDSLTVEGIDASAVAAAAPGWRVLNAALNFGDRIDQEIMTPSLAKARPALVVWLSRPMQLGAAKANLHADRAAAYRVGDFPRDWPQGWLSARSDGLSSGLYATLDGSEWMARAHFHTWLINASYQRLRNNLRRGNIRSTAAGDWIAPYQMVASIAGDRLERHIEAIKREHEDRLARGRFPDSYQRIVRHLADAGARPVIVLAPIHPHIRARGWFDSDTAEFTKFATELAASTNALFLDTSALLDAQDFADGQHPAAAGRAKLSEFIGKQLPPPHPAPSKGR
ncbi:MAG: hypothetical protein IT434_14575 [Phycisphaerales bacterium]|nr:hypothetical protein [Phycisphaerales bacterium]